MADYFFKIFTSLRNCNVACSPALRLGGASEQLSSLCLQKVHSPLFKLDSNGPTSERARAAAGGVFSPHVPCLHFAAVPLMIGFVNVEEGPLSRSMFVPPGN